MTFVGNASKSDHNITTNQGQAAAFMSLDCCLFRQHDDDSLSTIGTDTEQVLELSFCFYSLLDCHPLTIHLVEQ